MLNSVNKFEIEQRKKPSAPKQVKGKPCPYCHGTLYWKFNNGKECVRCKFFFSNKTPIKK